MPLTVRHLLTMSGGYDYSPIGNTVKRQAVLDIAGANASTLKVINAYAQLPLLFEPGSRFCYSICHEILAGIVETVSGLAFNDYVNQNIFIPLGMTHSSYRHSPEFLKKITNLYRFVDGAVKPVEKINRHVLTPNYASGGAGTISTVDDYSLFADAMASGGTAANGYRILRPDTIRLLSQPQLRYTIVKSNGYTTTIMLWVYEPEPLPGPAAVPWVNSGGTVLPVPVSSWIL